MAREGAGRAEQQTALRLTERALAVTQALLAVQDDALLRSFTRELQRYRQLVRAHWPLSAAERAGVDIGRVAMRELDGGHPDYVTLLCRLGALLRQEAPHPAGGSDPGPHTD